jgi:hydrogenase expression/formation protein HypE
METLCRVVQSMKEAALQAGVLIVTGDTKVVDKGKGDGLFVNTAGIGVVEHKLAIAPRSARPGDAVILNGDLGRHGIAIMAARGNLKLQTDVQSDAAPLSGLVERLLKAGVEVHCLRDLTRGGLASALNEIAEAAGIHIQVEESKIPVLPAVQGACELLGYDPMYVANEGRLAAFVPASQAKKALESMRACPEGAGACLVGTVLEKGSPKVTVKSRVGVTRILDMLSGEQLPRIC